MVSGAVVLQRRRLTIYGTESTNQNIIFNSAKILPKSRNIINTEDMVGLAGRNSVQCFNAHPHVGAIAEPSGFLPITTKT